YAALAGAAYNRALMLDQSNQVVRNKLNLISELDRVPGQVIGGSGPVASAVPTPPPAPAPAQPLARSEAPAPAAAAPASAPAMADNEAITNAIFAWTRAWSAQDLSAYFAAYAEDFKPEGG